LRSLLGDYAVKTRAETFMKSKQPNQGATPERTALRGARLVVASELSDAQRFDESFLKDVTGGMDHIAARNLYEGMVEFRPEFKLWLYGNNKPRLRSDDDAAWRRLHLIPFEVRIPLDEQDPELGLKLTAELPGILNWALDGLKDWQRVKLAPPAKVSAAVKEYRREMDDMGRFLEECCVEEANASVQAGTLYSNYAKWCDENGLSPMSNRRFSPRMKERGYQQHPRDGREFWQGIGLRVVGVASQSGAGGGGDEPY
jgi:putative DNA primase/helicase